MSHALSFLNGCVHLALQLHLHCPTPDDSAAVQAKAEGSAPQYTAVVFNDSMIHSIAEAVFMPASWVPDNASSSLPATPDFASYLTTAAAAALLAQLPGGKPFVQFSFMHVPRCLDAAQAHAYNLLCLIGV